MDTDFDDILHSQGLITQIWISSCLPIKQITPTFLDKTCQKVKYPVGNYNKKLEFIFVLPSDSYKLQIFIESDFICQITISQKAALSTSYWLLRSKIILTKRLFVRNWFLSEKFFSFVTIWFLCCGHNLRCWVLSNLNFLVL